MRSVAAGLAAAVAMALGACSSSAPQATASSPAQASPSPSQSVQTAPATSPTPAARRTPDPSTLSVLFTGLPAGRYPVHLHSACNGTQAFHITVMPSLTVGAAGSGSIGVPRSYFGRGLCLIVYGSAALTTVLRTRRI